MQIKSKQNITEFLMALYTNIPAILDDINVDMLQTFNGATLAMIKHLLLTKGSF